MNACQEPIMSTVHQKRNDSRIRKHANRTFRAFVLIVVTSVIVCAQDTPFPDVTNLSLEDLMNLKVTSVEITR